MTHKCVARSVAMLTVWQAILELARTRRGFVDGVGARRKSQLAQADKSTRFLSYSPDRLYYVQMT